MEHLSSLPAPSRSVRVFAFHLALAHRPVERETGIPARAHCQSCYAGTMQGYRPDKASQTHGHLVDAVERALAQPFEPVS